MKHLTSSSKSYIEIYIRSDEIEIAVQMLIVRNVTNLTELNDLFKNLTEPIGTYNYIITAGRRKL